MDELIVIKQLPIIEEQLKTVKTDIENKVADILALECTEETVKTIKKLRTDLKKDFNNFEDRRKAVKQKILEPYETFNGVYAECVKDVFDDADNKLRNRIDEVEDTIKTRKCKEVKSYFDEYLESKNIDFVGFKDANIHVTLSASVKSLKEKAKSFIDGIESDLKLINTQEYKEEILVEYRKTLKASAAITAVIERHKAIEAEKKRQAQAEQFRQKQREAAEKASAAAEKMNTNEPEPLSLPKTVEVAETTPLSPPKTADDDPIIIMRIGLARVKAKKSACIILKQLLTNGEYEILDK